MFRADNLVLLVIFIITAPLLTHAVKVDLPKAANSPTETPQTSMISFVKGKAEISHNFPNCHR